MTRVIGRIARGLGLARRAEVEALQHKLAHVRQKLEGAQRQLSDAAATAAQQQRSHASALERYQQKLSAVEASRDRDVWRAQQAAAKASERVTQLEQELEKRNAQLEALAGEATALEGRVTGSVAELEAAREQLMAVEMKLNLLEGAATMLDLRVRQSQSPVPDGSR